MSQVMGMCEITAGATGNGMHEITAGVTGNRYV